MTPESDFVVNDHGAVVPRPPRAKPGPAVAWCLGLDLGQSQDPSALVIDRVTFRVQADGAWSRLHDIVHLKLWQLKTPYTVDESLLARGLVKPGIAQDVRELVARPPLVRPRLAVDYTGVGRPVVDILRAAEIRAQIWPVCTTAGQQEGAKDGGFSVPKRSLVARTLEVLYADRLRIGRLPERAKLLQQFDTFRMKINANANESFEAWRGRDHDDLVFALMLAVWLGERIGPPDAGLAPADSPRSPTQAERMSLPSAQQRRGLYGLKPPTRRN